MGGKGRGEMKSVHFLKHIQIYSRRPVLDVPATPLPSPPSQVKLFEYNVGIMQVLSRTIIIPLDISFTHVIVCMHQEVGMHLKHHM
jgi:hypothetical protein